MQSQTFSDKKNQEAIHFRCPQCQKLYSALVSNFQSQEPHFECLHCHSVFGLDLSLFQADLGQSTHPLESDKAIVETICKSDVLEGNSVSKKECPKCGTLNKVDAKECKSCQVIFSKMEGLELAGDLKVPPRIIQKWKALLENFENQSLHQEFIESCASEKLLAFALERYEVLDKSFGGDSLARKNLEQIRVRITSPLEIPLDRESSALKSFDDHAENNKDENDEIPIRSILTVLSYALGVLLFILGLMKAGPKNSAGFGVVIILMTYGVIYFIDNRKKLL